MTLREFLSWGAQYKSFPYSQISYWVDAAERQDGKDMYGSVLEKSSRPESWPPSRRTP